MTVKELIEKLKEMPEDCEVYIIDEDELWISRPGIPNPNEPDRYISIS